jgi:hypothetical protein
MIKYVLPMKFAHLPPGQRFVFQGERYTKSGPLTATREQDGVVRMIPRSATVLPPDTVPPGPPPDRAPMRPWQAALDAYEDRLREQLGPQDAEQERRLAAALGAARAAFEAALP